MSHKCCNSTFAEPPCIFCEMRKKDVPKEEVRVIETSAVSVETQEDRQEITPVVSHTH